MQRNADRGTSKLGTSRLEAFSDGVFAIAVTLLVLDLAVPPEETPVASLLGAWPAYLAYVISFATIGALWLAHSVLTEHLATVDGELMRTNLLLLLLVSFLPFPTRLLGDYIKSEQSERLATTLYGVVLTLSVATLAQMWRHSVQAGLLVPDVDTDVALAAARRLRPAVVAYPVMVGLGLLVPMLAVLGYLVISVALLIPWKVRRHRD